MPQAGGEYHQIFMITDSSNYFDVTHVIALHHKFGENIAMSFSWVSEFGVGSPNWKRGGSGNI